jgi:hypothetical protein
MKDKFVNIIKTYGTAFMTVVAVVSFLFALGVKSERKDSGNAIVVADIKVIKDSINSISKQLYPIKDQLINITEKQTEAKVAYNSLRLLVLDIKSKEPGMTIDQFRQILESTPELKKKGLTNQIPYRNDLNLTLK